MKANQNFRQAEEAVSPVIGVILMVAITVVLAAVVFVLVGSLGGDATTAPAIGWQASEGADTLTVTKAPSDFAWADLSIASSDATVNYTLNGGTAQDLTVAGAPVVSTANIGPNDVFQFCAPTDVTATITFTHPDSGSLVRQEEFDITTGTC